MSAISSATEVAIKQTVENAIKDYHASILPYLGARPMMAGGDVPIGAVNFFDDVDAPQGWVKADGSILNIADYPYLADHYERVHGSKNYYGGDGTTTFAVPDWRGEFFRASGPNAHPNQGNGGTVGEHQDGTEFAELNLSSMSLNPRGIVEANNNNIYNVDSYNKRTIRQADISTISNEYANIGIPTSRPTNTSLLCCIKAVPAGINYSLEEQEVGTWIDGKKLYQKTVSTGAAVPSGATEISRITNGQTGYDTIQYTKA